VLAGRVAEDPIIAAPAVTSPMTKTAAVTSSSLAFVMDLTVPSGTAMASAETMPVRAPIA
jgi:hypothetical protein